MSRHPERRPRRAAGRAAVLVAAAIGGLVVGGCASGGGAGARAPDPLFGLGGRNPEALRTAALDPYAPPSGDCAAIEREIAVLDAILGPVSDIADEDDREQIEAWLLDAARGLVPYRGAMRFLAGARRADRRRAAETLSGFARRGFLRGVAWARGCAPAAGTKDPGQGR